MDHVEEILTLNGALQRSYTGIRNRFYNKHYKPFLRDDEGEGNDQGDMRVKLRQGPLSLKVSRSTHGL
jgi:hypothetical protein